MQYILLFDKKIVAISKIATYNIYTDMNLLHEVHLYLGWPQGPGPPAGEDLPRHFIYTEDRRFMKNKILSVFVDESGDFGKYNSASPYYYVGMVLHNQDIDISKNIYALEKESTF